MKTLKDIKQQLRKELLKEDPSLSGRKKDFLELFDRIEKGKPKIEQDEFFQKRLQDRLQYDLITRYESAPQPTRRHKLLLYGTPSIIIAAVLLYLGPLSLWSSSSEHLGEEAIKHISSGEMYYQEEMIPRSAQDLGDSHQESFDAASSARALPEGDFDSKDAPHVSFIAEPLSGEVQSGSGETPSTAFLEDQEYLQTPDRELRYTISDGGKLKGSFFLITCDEYFEVSGRGIDSSASTRQDLEYTSRTRDMTLNYLLPTEFQSGKITNIFNRESLCK